MVTCEACGQEVPAGQRFCSGCGAAIGPPGGNERPGKTLVPEGIAGEHLHWNRKIPLITNPYLVLQCIFTPLGIAIVMGSFLSLITGGEWGLLILFLMIGAGLSVLMLLIMLVLQLITGGGLDTEFFISNEGVAHGVGSTTRALNRVSTGGSAVLGSLSGTGAGLLAMSQENTMLPWEDVRYISVYRSMRSLVFRSRYLVSPVVLYCSEENYPAILAMVKKYAPPLATGNL
jgi:hypothetical protein